MHAENDPAGVEELKRLQIQEARVRLAIARLERDAKQRDLAPAPVSLANEPAPVRQPGEKRSSHQARLDLWDIRQMTGDEIALRDAQADFLLKQRDLSAKSRGFISTIIANPAIAVALVSSFVSLILGGLPLLTNELREARETEKAELAARRDLLGKIVLAGAGDPAKTMTLLQTITELGVVEPQQMDATLRMLSEKASQPSPRTRSDPPPPPPS